MNISAIGSNSWLTSIRSSTHEHIRSGRSQSSSSDSATISPQAFAALMQNQQGDDGPPEISDDAASKIGASMQSQNASMFKAFDSDGNGTLSAKELKNGMESLRSAFESADGSDGSSASSDTSGPPPMTDDMAAKIGSMMQKQDPDTFKSMDTDKDGKLSAKELKSGMESLLSTRESTDGSDGSSASSDTDGLPPMTDDMAAKIGSMMQKQDPDTFKSIDTDKDGKLSAKELQAGMENGTLPPPPQFNSSNGASSFGSQSGSVGIDQLFGSSKSSGKSDFYANLMNELLQSLGNSSST